MGFFRKEQKTDGKEAARTVGLVIEAPAPPEGGPGLGPGTRAHVRVQADLGTGRRVHETRIRLSEEHWLVPGMDVEVTFDPGRPDRFEIDWDRVPSMAARAVANDLPDWLLPHLVEKRLVSRIPNGRYSAKTATRGSGAPGCWNGSAACWVRSR